MNICVLFCTLYSVCSIPYAMPYTICYIPCRILAHRHMPQVSYLPMNPVWSSAGFTPIKIFNGYEELLNRIETINGVRVEKVFFGVVISNGMGYRPACYPLVLTSFPTVCATCLTDS